MSRPYEIGPWVVRAEHVPGVQLGLRSREILVGGRIVGRVADILSVDFRHVTWLCLDCDPITTRRVESGAYPAAAVGELLEHWAARHAPATVPPQRPAV